MSQSLKNRYSSEVKRPWIKVGKNNPLYLELENIYSLWLENNKCSGYILGHNILNISKHVYPIVSYFENIGNPAEDTEYIRFINI